MAREQQHTESGARGRLAADSGASETPGKQTLTAGLVGPTRPGSKRAGDDSEQQVAELPPDQRSYYEQILASSPDPNDREARERALETATSSRPLTDDDRAAVIAAQQKLASLKATPIDDRSNPNLVQLQITFDGTWNDRDEMLFDTNPALVNERFEGIKDYQVGVGTGGLVDRYLGGGTGRGLAERIDRAYANVVAQVNALKTANPNAEVVLVVTGFSRGSTAARAFVNELNRRGVPDLSSQRPDGSFERQHAGPRIGVMVLFDTVASVGIPGNSFNYGMDLSIPANAENVLHLTARDEKRMFFPLDSAVDPARPNDPRITEIALPGAHSDVGGSYPNPYSQISLQMGLEYMAQRGVNVAPLSPDEIVDPNRDDLRLHDSGGRRSRRVYPSQNPR
jgi:hypothetical protein